MDARSVIAAIRSGQLLTPDAARWFGTALSGTAISDAQAGAFAMATCMNGLDRAARVALTEGMRDSGDVLVWDLPGPVLDKHSTGGVGDPVSLLLAPALAECGAYVPMISGRGLGHTGGTLDKLEAIPGYICELGPKRLEHVLREAGCAIVGATGRVAPSDRRLYAIRDVTATVDSIDLITASILSKKLAAGLDGLVLDVKTGSGAFMADPRDAKALAGALVEVANGAGCKTSALITDMSQPLADAAGNAVEIRAVMETLTGSRVNTRLRDVVIALGAQVLDGAPEANAEKLTEILESGRAAERFARMVAAMGGPLDFAESWQNCLPEAPVLREVTGQEVIGQEVTGQEVTGQTDQWVQAIDTRALGEAVVSLGGGRLRDGEPIDPAVGLSALVPVGTKLTKAAPLAMVHAATEAAADRAVAAVRGAYRLGPDAPPATPLVFDTVLESKHP